MIRRLLFILFLYVLLVWILAAYLYLGDSRRMLSQGLLWTAIGVAALLVWLVAERLFSSWRVRRAQQASRPAPAAGAPPQQTHEDDAGLASLLFQADQKLAAANPPERLANLPLYLCVGPEGSGKTSVVHNCGVEPTLLAGQVAGGGAAVAPTRVANVWLLQRSVFLEVSGRVFNSEPQRLGQFLQVLQGGDAAKGWKSWLRGPQPQVSLRAILLCLDSREFSGTPEPSKLDRMAEKIRQRLSAIAAVLGAEVPVYVLFSKTDAVPYFGDYFARLRPSETGQVFGSLIADEGRNETQDRVWAEAATKRFSRHFQSLFLRLSDRRMLALTQELEAARKPAVYEFPREFKKIRPVMIQFLVDVFKPDPLRPAPRLRGFFFTGTRKVERSGRSDEETHRAFRPPAGSEATQMFSGAVTTFGDPSPKSAKPAGPVVDQWLFLTELFQKVLMQDRPRIRRVAAPGALVPYRRIVLGTAAGVAGALALVWTVSWIGNLRLESRVEGALEGVRRGSDEPSQPVLEALDRLRGEIEDLEDNDSWSLHWGLYTGDSLRQLARRAYFVRLRRVSLDRINQGIALQLAQAGSGQSDLAGVTYDRLKTHRTITSLGCPVDRPLVAKVLKTAAADTFPGLPAGQMELLEKQLDFYAADLEKNKKLPVALAEDPNAEARARDYLRQAGGLDQRLRFVLSQLRQQLRPIPVSQAVDNYKSVLRGRDDYDAVFTKKGAAAFEQQLAGDSGGGGEPCVMGGGAGSQVTREVLDVGAKERLKSLYYRQYADAWRDFLASYSVIRYASARDAASKLDILSGSTSPLLGIVKLVAVNTSYPPQTPNEPSYWEKAAQTVGLGGLVQAKTQAQQKAQKAADRASQLLSNDAPLMTAADLWRLFQPARYTTPPDVDRLVNDKDQGYINGLRGLEQSLDAFDRASASERGAAMGQARAALAQAQMAHAALSDNFSDVGNEGLNKQLADLLEQPIRLAIPLLPANLEVSQVQKQNGALKQLCESMAPILTKYPFASSNLQSDTTLADVARGFAPAEGLVWKYVQKSATDIVVRQGKEWQQKPDLQGVKVAPELIVFLNRAQQLTDVMFAEGGMVQPKLRYVLRPISGSVNIKLVLDGTELNSQNPLQKTFYWPATTGEPGATGTVELPGFSAGFGRFGGLWGVFKLFQIADNRTYGAQTVQWSEARGLGGAAPQPINPPAKIQFVEFPGGVDLFNPEFFRPLHCPGTAAVAN